MKFPSEVKKDIEKYILQKNITITYFCKIVWISRPTYYKLVSWKNRRIKDKTIQCLKILIKN